MSEKEVDIFRDTPVRFLGDDKNVGSGTSTWYAAKRLVRGLASATAERQTIMYSTLTTALMFDAIPVTEVLSALDHEIKSNSDQSAVLTTTVLTCGSVIKSGKFQELSQSDQINVVQRIVASGKKKQYLYNAIVYFLIHLMSMLSKSNFKKIVWSTIKGELDDATQVSENPLHAVGLIVSNKYPKLTAKLIQKRFGDQKKLLEDVVRRSLHYTDGIQERVLSEACSSLATSSKQLLGLWKTTLKIDHKPGPKWENFVLTFAQFLLNAVKTPALLTQILKPELIKVILNSRRIPEKSAKKTTSSNESQNILELIVNRLSEDDVDDDTKINVIKKLIFYPGDLQFDSKTKTKTVQLIVGKLGVTGIKSLANELVEIVKGSTKKQDEDEITREWTNKEKQLVLSMLHRLVSHNAMVKESDFVLSTVQFIFNVGFLKTELGTSSELRKSAKDIFYKVIELRSYKIDDAVALLHNITSFVNGKVTDLGLDESAQGQWKSMMTANEKMRRKSGDKAYIAVRLLLLHMGLTLFRDPELATTTIQELLQCYNRLNKEREARKRASGVPDDEPRWVEVTVDLLLAMLSRENKLMRNIVSAVFPSIAPHVTPTALQQIVDALDPTARNDVLKHVDSDDSDDEEGSEGDNEDMDEESDGSAVEEEEDVEHETVNDKLRMAVRNALGYSAALTDDESVDMDDMNEDEELKLNESLANAFKLFRAGKNSKKKQSKDDEALTHFRVRVLDLVEIVLSSNPSLASCLELIPPLFALLEFAIKDRHQKPLQNRLENVLRKVGGVKKFSDVTSVEYKDVVAALSDLTTRDTSGLIYVEMGPAITECCGLLVRASQLLPKDGDDTVEEALVKLLDRHFFANDRRVPYTIFQVVLRMLWDGNWRLVDYIMELLLNPEMKLFKKQKLADLLEIFYRNDRLHSTATDDQKALACTTESNFADKFALLLADYNRKQKNSKVLAAFYSKLLPFLQLAITSRKKYREDYGSDPRWSVVIEELLQCSDLFLHQKSKTRLLNLARLCEVAVPNVANRKRKASATEESSESEEEEDSNLEEENVKKRTSVKREDEEEGKQKPMKKRVASNNAKKLKKESRELREAASAQGLGSFSFSTLTIPANLENIEADPSPVKKKLKSESPKKKSRQSL